MNERSGAGALPGRMPGPSEAKSRIPDSYSMVRPRGLMPRDDATGRVALSLELVTDQRGHGGQQLPPIRIQLERENALILARWLLEAAVEPSPSIGR